MTYYITKTSKGKVVVVAEGDRKKMLARLAQLRQSTKGKVYGYGGGHRVVFALR